MKWCFFEFCLENKKFINSNLNFFKKLTFYLIQTKKIKDGKLFTKAWNKTFLNTFNHAFNESILNEKLQICYNKNVDPLEQVIKIAKQIDDFLKKSGVPKKYTKTATVLMYRFVFSILFSEFTSGASTLKLLLFGFIKFPICRI